MLIFDFTLFHRILQTIVVIIIFSDACVNALSDSLSHHIKIQYTKPDALSRQIISVIDELAKRENIETMRRTLNFVIICSAKCIQYSLAMVRFWHYSVMHVIIIMFKQVAFVQSSVCLKGPVQMFAVMNVQTPWAQLSIHSPKAVQFY